MVKKKDIRKNVLYKRDQIGDKEWEANSNIIFNKVVSHSFFLEEEHILCFLNYQSEVDTRQIIKCAWAAGKTVYAPRIDGDIMNFYRISSLDDLREGYKSIPEPIGNERFDGNSGLVIMPGVVFDKSRNRIGYGKGYYDRYLSEHPKLKTLAIAFSLQVLDQIPVEQFDIKPEVLMTEENTYDSKFTE